MGVPRRWDVLLIGGASGVGKTHVSYRLAHHFGVGITEIDDFHVILERMTTPAQQPVLHFFRTDPDSFFRLDDEGKLAHAIRYMEVMAEPLEYVIANHLDGGSPIVLEGDFLLPSLATRPTYDGITAAGRVRAVIIYEQEEDQIARNYLAREGEPQPDRARASWRHSEWLRREAERLGLPTIAARPWDTVFERALTLLQASDEPGVSQ
jgi:2-phosphoglycerate kinase